MIKPVRPLMKSSEGENFWKFDSHLGANETETSNFVSSTASLMGFIDNSPESCSSNMPIFHRRFCVNKYNPWIIKSHALSKHRHSGFAFKTPARYFVPWKILPIAGNGFEASAQFQTTQKRAVQLRKRDKNAVHLRQARYSLFKFTNIDGNFFHNAQTRWLCTSSRVKR